MPDIREVQSQKVDKVLDTKQTRSVYRYQLFLQNEKHPWYIDKNLFQTAKQKQHITIQYLSHTKLVTAWK